MKYNVEKDSDQNWIGTMGPYLNMLGCWGLRLQELRVGHTKMPVARDGDKMSVVPIEKYGLSPSHAVHLEGITYPVLCILQYCACSGQKARIGTSEKML